MIGKTGFSRPIAADLETGQNPVFRACSLPDCNQKRGWRWKLGIRTPGIWCGNGWYCSPECLEVQLLQSIAGFTHRLPDSAPSCRVPLGLTLISKGRISAAQLQSALQAQKDCGGALGSWLQKLGYITEDQLTVALAQQWGSPMMPGTPRGHLSCRGLLPLVLLQHFRMLPVWHSPRTGKLVIAFSQGILYSMLNAIGEMLRCTPESCVISASALDCALSELGRDRSPNDVLFERCRTAQEVAGIVRSYLARWNAREIRLQGCGSILWVRMMAGRQAANLLFRCRPAEESF